MDACYSGIALQRGLLQPGSMRFLKDMLQRYSRQILTAGKENETVSDSGGPLPNHSVFTGHLIEALNGKAETTDGAITANGVISYVYERVAKDPHSNQTPHYGFLDGDGDFIFKAPMLKSTTESPTTDDDVLVSIPSTMPEAKTEPSFDIVSTIKEYLSDSKNNIKLHDVISQKLREFVFLLQDNKFDYDLRVDLADEFRGRIKYYEALVRDLQLITICISYWGAEVHSTILRKIIARATDPIDARSGSVFLLNLRWYPIMLLTYAAGISAIASNNYSFLSDILLGKFKSTATTTKTVELASTLGNISREITNVFKTFPGHDKHYAPRSEYLFKYFQPFFDDILFLGSDYEQMFDKFEVFLALVCADLNKNKDDHFWGPPGRFAWKFGARSSNPLNDILEEAESKKDEWAPIKQGLFQGSYDRFIEIISKYKQIVGQLGWI